MAIPTQLVSTTGALDAGSSITLSDPGPEGSMRARFGQALGSALSARNIAVEENARLIAEFAYSERDAGVGSADPAASSGETIVWSSEPRDPDWLDNCSATRARATLVLLDTADGSIRYRGVAESTDCTITPAHVRELADALLEDALSL